MWASGRQHLSGHQNTRAEPPGGWGRSVPGRGHCKCKDLEARLSLVGFCRCGKARRAGVGVGGNGWGRLRLGGLTGLQDGSWEARKLSAGDPGSVELLKPFPSGRGHRGQPSSEENAKVTVSQAVTPGPSASESPASNWAVMGSLLVSAGVDSDHRGRRLNWAGGPGGGRGGKFWEQKRGREVLLRDGPGRNPC